ncbi:MAG: FAD-dependent oxidoreductase [Candidatus Kapaibacterium sp.]
MTENYGSWGRYPKLQAAEVVKLFWKEEIPELDKFDKDLLPYGMGKSYGDSCLNEGGILLDARGLNKLMSFDPLKGIIMCESGVSLAEILDFVVPRGWFLSSTPGTKYITVGGAIANDVHGKNHHKGGTFGNHVISFELLRSDGTRMICSRDDNPEMFAATIGGLGLTGLITWAKFSLKPCPGPFFDMESIKFSSLEEFFEINDESNKNFDYTVAWVDTTASGGDLGRGIYNRGNHADPGDSAPPLKEGRPLPFPLEAALINPASVKAFNTLYYNKQPDKYQRNIVHYNPFFYPLDAVNDWNRAYGKSGFQQYQFVVPFKHSMYTVKSILTKTAETGMSSFLTVLKSFGDVKSPGMLSFPEPGITMAIDFKMVGQKTLDLIDQLDDIVRDAGGKLYPAKDAHMSGEDFRRFYPIYEEFLKYKDPKFSSSFWRRVMK